MKMGVRGKFRDQLNYWVHLNHARPCGDRRSRGGGKLLISHLDDLSLFCNRLHKEARALPRINHAYNDYTRTDEEKSMETMSETPSLSSNSSEPCQTGGRGKRSLPRRPSRIP